MIDRKHAPPVVRQCEILSLSRSLVYYRRRPVSPEDLVLMRRIDELHLELPFAGARMLRDLLRGLSIIRPQVWAMDITYIPMQRGFVYLAAVIGQGCWRDNFGRRGGVLWCLPEGTRRWSRTARVSPTTIWRWR